jgi:hypothetical protein
METLDYNWQSTEKSAAKWDAVFRGINQGHGEPLQHFITRIANAWVQFQESLPKNPLSDRSRNCNNQ